jgi:branched-subunit amino acid aminotransferase/4-amino-4-deoxychorismate lyase
MTYCYLNGQIILQSAANIGITDLTLLRGHGVFDYFVFEHQRPRFLDDYVNRFFNSAAHLHLSAPVSKEALRQGVLDLIAANNIDDGGIRLVLTGGYSADGYTPTVGNIFILQYPFPQIPAALFEKGAAVATYQHQRELPEAKSLSYMTGIKLLPWLKAQKADYPLYHDGVYLRESDRSNFFLVGPEGQLITSADKILGGITRAKVIELAKAYGIPVELREVAVTELATAREVLFTSSIKGVLPITLIDGKPVADGQPGPMAKRLQDGFLRLVQEPRFQ